MRFTVHPRHRRFIVRSGTSALIACVVLVLASCSSSKPSASGSANSGSGSATSAAPVRVALITDLTGVQATLTGQASPAAVKAVADKVNAAGGISGHPIEIVGPYDSQSTAAGGEAAAQQAVSANPDFVIITSSSTSVSATLPAFAAARIPVIDTAGGSDVVEPVIPLHFSLNTEAHQLVDAMVDEAKKTSGRSPVRIALIGIDAPSVDGYLNVLKGLPASEGVDLVDVQRTTSALTSFTSQAAEIVRSKPDAVILLDSLTSSVLESAALTQAGYTGVLLNSSTLANNTAAAKVNNPNLYVLKTVPSPTSETGIFAAATNAHLGSNVTDSTYFTLSWLAAQVGVDIYQKCGYGCSPDAFQHTAETMGDINLPNYLAFGPIRFTPSRHYGLTAVQFYKWDTQRQALIASGAVTTVTS